MDMPRFLRLLGSSFLGLATLASAVPASAQSCALCYTQAASSGTRMIQALQSGILILVVPPTLGSLVVIGILYRKRNHFYQADANTGA
jgi:hypothetical protein